ncbi:uncharacterized protein EDB91DRAFT_1316416 [Suillus paluster]|uniref:uncharacterized protein n=1 Tax=Suillus paluster TaxID=48578 RepID=UPI001B881CE5|nr:uncharacterized protein EDB91DRAFT_1316416 [Suillus paluster]KAG1726970.1 hypothetical protein EDB91DRAFT_1316416 [Suillus paluster]
MKTVKGILVESTGKRWPKDSIGDILKHVRGPQHGFSSERYFYLWNYENDEGAILTKTKGGN